jgi:hypothetical protein
LARNASPLVCHFLPLLSIFFLLLSEKWSGESNGTAKVSKASRVHDVIAAVKVKVEVDAVEQVVSQRRGDSSSQTVGFKDKENVTRKTRLDATSSLR